MNSTELLSAITFIVRQQVGYLYDDNLKIIKQDLEDYLIIKEIEDNVRAGKKVILNDKKYYACEFILAEEGTIRHLTISYNNYKKILRFEDYKKSWKFED